MKAYFFLIMFCLFTHSQGAFGEAELKHSYAEYNYPAIAVTPEFSDKIFMDPSKKLLNCPMLFNNAWEYPNGSSIALCDDAQLACIRYGLILQKIKKATGPLLRELQKTLVISKEEVKLRLRGCELVIEATGIGTQTMQEAAGYPTDPTQ